MYQFDSDKEENFSSDHYRRLIHQSETGGLEELDKPKEPVDISQYPTESDDIWQTAEEVSDTDAMRIIKASKGKKKDFSQQVDNMLTIHKDSAVDVANTFKNLFEELNTTYGLNIQFSFDSFTQTLGYLIEPKNQKAIELYLSESYSRVRATLYMMYLNAIAQLSQQILDPRFISSNSMSYSDKLILMRELFQYIKSLDEIYEKVKVDDSDVRLRKLAEEDQGNDNLNDEGTQRFLENLMQMVKQGDKA